MMAGITRFRLIRVVQAINHPILVILLILIVATGCVETGLRYTPVPFEPTPTATPPPPPPPPTPTPTPTPTPIPIPPTTTPTAVATAATPPTLPTPIPTATPVPPTPTPEPTGTPVATPIPILSTTTFNLALDFEGIGDESIVRGETVLLRGATSAAAIVSVNDVIVEVQADGTFELTLLLDPGPNFVDVVASSLDGSTINSSLAIISIPPEETS
jgi:hypothetical protein